MLQQKKLVMFVNAQKTLVENILVNIIEIIRLIIQWINLLLDMLEEKIKLKLEDKKKEIDFYRYFRQLIPYFQITFYFIN